jgi:hypothetical protein
VPFERETDVLRLNRISATRDLDNADRIAVEIWDPLVGQTMAASFDSVAGHMGSIRLFEAFSRKL